MNRRGLLLVGLVAAILIVVLLRGALAPTGGDLARPGAGTGEHPGGVATATAADVPIGVAATGGWYELYSSNPKYPDDRKGRGGGLDAKLVGLIDRSQQTLDVADYNFDLASVAGAMARATQRGVRVRMVTDSDTLGNKKDEAIQAAFATLQGAGIPIVEDNRVAIMHNKFAVVDGEWLSTGSWNYTDGDSYRLNNWMGIFRAKELAARYGAEFGEMFEQRKFGGAKLKRVPGPPLAVDGARVQTCFSPKGGCADLIVDTIARKAQQSIQFMAFSFTHDGIGKAIADKAKAGVKVTGVFETTGSQTQFSEYGQMKQAGLDVYTDGNPYVMHHKAIILDGRLTIAGSFNFSNNADKDNDENLLIVEDGGVAQFFQAEFERVLAVAKNPPRKN